MNARMADTAWAPPGWAWRLDEKGNPQLIRNDIDDTDSVPTTLASELAFLALLLVLLTLFAGAVLLATGVDPSRITPALLGFR